jgi:hypothetical protein
MSGAGRAGARAPMPRVGRERPATPRPVPSPCKTDPGSGPGARSRPWRTRPCSGRRRTRARRARSRARPGWAHQARGGRTRDQTLGHRADRRGRRSRSARHRGTGTGAERRRGRTAGRRRGGRPLPGSHRPAPGRPGGAGLGRGRGGRRRRVHGRVRGGRSHRPARLRDPACRHRPRGRTPDHRCRGQTRSPGFPSGSRLVHQPADPLHHRRVEARQGADLDVQALLLNAIQQLMALQA